MIEALEDRVEEVDGFKDWLEISRPGDACVYHVGHLAPDREAKGGRELHRLANAILKAAGYHLYTPRTGDDVGVSRYVRTKNPTVCLVQRRCKAGFEYLAVRR